MDRQFHVRVFFYLFCVFFQVLSKINWNMLSQIQVINFWEFLVFKKHQCWVLIEQRAIIFILEHFFICSCKIWYVIYRSVQIWKRIAKKFYPKLAIYLSTVFCRPLYVIQLKVRGLVGSYIMCCIISNSWFSLGISPLCLRAGSQFARINSVS